MLLLGYLGAIVMGLSLGLIGGGGSILAVPILVYLFGLSGIHATFDSLFVVGICAAIGVVSFSRRRLVEFKTGLVFFFPSVLGVLLSRRVILPAIPEIITLHTIHITKDLLILTLFGIVMLGASISMLRSTDKKVKNSNKSSSLRTTLVGIIVGAITGLVGAGGGFLIVPALVNGMSLPMERAVGTSLFIITLNSLSGFFIDWISGTSVTWILILPFTALAILGVLLGTYLNNFIPSKILKPAFGWFVLILGILIIIRQILYLSN